MIRTKIVATLGPASSQVDTLVRLFEEGTDVCRLNFSHGELADHLGPLKNIREAATRWGEHIAILGDLGGPKIRLSKVADEGNTGGMTINTGDVLTIQREPIIGANLRVSTTYPQFVDDIAFGHRVLIEDGLLRFVVIDKTDNEVACACTSGGILKSSKGVNLPNTVVRIPSITDRDWKCVTWAIENELDYLALSFVRRAEDIIELRNHLKMHESTIRIIAKIEKAEALEQIDAILEAADGLMIARGDLGVEMDLAQVPIIQKDLIRRCQTACKPVIVATQMLQSMIEQSSPTRAEVSDVANAIFDGADAVMLSGETSVGKYPLAAVHIMAHIAEITEEYLDTHASNIQPAIRPSALQLSVAVAHGVWQIVHDLKIKLVAIWGQTGATARIFAKYRFPVPILALSSSPRTLRQMAMYYGVIPQELQAPAGTALLVAQIDKLVREKEFATHGDRIVIVSGSTAGIPGTMDRIVIHTVGSPPLPLEKK